MKTTLKVGALAVALVGGGVASAPANAVLTYHLGALHWANYHLSGWANSLANWMVTNHWPTVFPVLNNRTQQFPILVPVGYGQGSTYPPGINEYVIIGPTTYD